MHQADTAAPASPEPHEPSGCTPTEALYGFGAWLSMRPGTLMLGAEHESPAIVSLIEQFRAAQGWPAPRADYHQRLQPVRHVAAAPAPAQAGAEGLPEPIATVEPAKPGEPYMSSLVMFGATVRHAYTEQADQSLRVLARDINTRGLAASAPAPAAAQSTEPAAWMRPSDGDIVRLLKSLDDAVIFEDDAPAQEALDIVRCWLAAASLPDPRASAGAVPAGWPSAAEVWRVAMTLANNLCAQESDRHRDDDENAEASAAGGCANRIRDWLEPGPETLRDLLIEGGAVLAAGQSAEARDAVVVALARRCYAMSQPHLSGFRVVIGFERLEDAAAAHAAIARLGRAAAASNPAGECQ
jgi:hypothetical protein